MSNEKAPERKLGQVTENESERGWAVRAAESGLGEGDGGAEAGSHVQGMDRRPVWVEGCGQRWSPTSACGSGQG